MKTVMAIGAHPDDIEILMAGTLLLLRDAGYAVHYLNVANGCCASTTLDRETSGPRPPGRIAGGDGQAGRGLPRERLQ